MSIEIEQGSDDGLAVFTTTVSPRRANAWLAEARFDGQRPVNRQHVSMLVEALRRGTFKIGTTLEFARLDGRAYLIDGQHRLHAIAEAGQTVTMVVVERNVATRDELAVAYARTDRGRSRTFVDAYNAHGLGESMGLSLRQLTLLGAAASLISVGFVKTAGNTYEGKSSDERIRMAQAWSKDATRYYRSVEGGWESQDKRLRLVGVVAVGLVTTRYQPDAAHSFWTALAQNDGLRRGTPIHTLVNWLTLPENRRYRENHVARAVARAWNAHYHGRELSVIRGFESSDAIEIAGTPFDGKAMNPLNPDIRLLSKAKPQVGG